MAITLYFSGFESSWPDLVKLKESKLEHTPKGIMMSYMHMQHNPKAWQNLKEFRSKYGGKVMIDSGAYSFLNNDIIENDRLNADGQKRTSEGARELKGKEDAYVHRYMDWCEANRDAYDWVVELDIQKLVGQDQVNEWREEFLKRGIPLVIVLHKNAGDTAETARLWKEKGCKYFGLGSGFDKEQPSDKQFLRDVAECGFVHIFGFTPKDMFDFKQYVTSTDSTTWLQAGKGAMLFEAKGRNLKDHDDIRHKPILIQKMMMGDVMQLWSKEDRDYAVNNHKYRLLNFSNLVEMQKWVDNNNNEPGYVGAVDSINSGAISLPDWATEKDRFGRSKAIYLKSRYNALKNGMYARELMKNALMCNNCIVRDKCPMFEKDALCAYMTNWRKAGGKTRNKEQIVRMVENIIQEKYARYERAKLMEAYLGGETDSAVSTFENDLTKSLELLHRVKYGVVGGGMKVALEVGKDGVKLGVAENTDGILKEMREKYGERLADKIRKRSQGEIAEAVYTEVESGDAGIKESTG